MQPTQAPAADEPHIAKLIAAFQAREGLIRTFRGSLTQSIKGKDKAELGGYRIRQTWLRDGNTILAMNFMVGEEEPRQGYLYRGMILQTLLRMPENRPPVQVIDTDLEPWQRFHLHPYEFAFKMWHWERPLAEFLTESLSDDHFTVSYLGQDQSPEGHAMHRVQVEARGLEMGRHGIVTVIYAFLIDADLGYAVVESQEHLKDFSLPLERWQCTDFHNYGEGLWLAHHALRERWSVDDVKSSAKGEPDMAAEFAVEQMIVNQAIPTAEFVLPLPPEAQLKETTPAQDEEHPDH